MFAVFSPAAQSNITAKRRPFLFFAGLFAVLLAAHLRHAGVLWAEEDLPLAIALQMKHGAMIYRDAWFDKPPLVPAIYLLWGVAIGPLLRFAGAAYGLIACVLVYGIADGLWSQREGYLAAALLAFFLTFDTHSAVLPLAADLLLLVPHLAAIFFAVRKQPLFSGIAAGVGFLFNAKAVLVLAACALFVWPGVISLLAGFVLPNVVALAWLAGAGALPAYLDQVWRWPAQYAGSPVVSNPVMNGAIRTLNWMGFHAALVIGAAIFWLRERQWKFVVWAAICYAGVVLGWRFFPRYFFLLLPALTICASRGILIVGPRQGLGMKGGWYLFRARRKPGGRAEALTLQRRELSGIERWRMSVLLLLLIPLIRFGPRYISLSNWSDLALDEDSRAASQIILAQSHPDSTLYVWGYRPEIYLYTHLKPATKYLECQAMTGVPADRHLVQSTVVLTQGTHEAREELARSAPDFVVDGLSPYNPALSVQNYPELRPWIAQYKEAGRTRGTIIYVRSTMR